MAVNNVARLDYAQLSADPLKVQTPPLGSDCKIYLNSDGVFILKGAMHDLWLAGCGGIRC